MNIGRSIKEIWELNRAYFLRKKRRRTINRNISDAEGLHERVCAEHKPVFVLSPGRSGTKTLTELFRKSPEIDVHHQPFPELIRHSRTAYEEQEKKPEALKYGVDMARYESIRDAHLLGRTYVETNNRITFFALQLAELFPKSLFIHLVRKPEDFVKSGLARGWYSRASLQEEGRIRPLQDKEDWERRSDASKIAWLWEETHEFIESFKKKEGMKGRVLTVRSEELFADPQKVKELFQFIGHPPIPRRSVEKVLKKPLNQQKKNKRELSSSERKEVEDLTPLKKEYYSNPSQDQV